MITTLHIIPDRFYFVFFMILAIIMIELVRHIYWFRRLNKYSRHVLSVMNSNRIASMAIGEMIDELLQKLSLLRKENNLSFQSAYVVRSKTNNTEIFPINEAGARLLRHEISGIIKKVKPIRVRIGYTKSITCILLNKPESNGQRIWLVLQFRTNGFLSSLVSKAA